MELLKINNLTIGYQTPIMQNLNFKLNSGEYLCIIGENGSGKSTLVKTILNLTPPLSGSIEWAIPKNEIGYLPQQTVVQRDFPATVMEVVMSGFQNKAFHPFYTKAEKQQARDNLEKLGISNLENRCYRELSGGQQQRVLLARALCGQQKILFLDEPISGLDPLATTEMYELVKKLHNEGVAIVMISHDIAASLKYATHILFADKQPQYFTNSEFKKSELGKKYTQHVGGHIGGHND